MEWRSAVADFWKQKLKIYLLTMSDFTGKPARAEECGNDPGCQSASGADRPGARELFRGERLSVFCDHQQPKYWPEHMHRQAQLFLTFDGADGEITWRRRSGNVVTEPLHAHQYCFIAPSCLYALKWKKAADVVLLHIGDRLVAEHLTVPMQGVVVEDFRPLTRLDGCLWSLAETLWEACRRPRSPGASFVEGIGTALAARVLERQFHLSEVTAKASAVLSQSLLKRLFAYIESHLDGDISVEELAKQAGLCEAHFARTFKNATGSSPSQFILKCRVEKGLELLRSGEFRIADAAFQVGFCDQSHFHRQCRKFFGLTPKAVLQKAQSAKLSKKKSESSKIAAA
jgi:AraC family transcriptional regulator